MPADIAPRSDTIEALRERIAILEEENRQLNELLVPSIIFPVEWALAVGEARILATLYGARGWVGQQRLLHALTFQVGGRWTEPDRAGIDVRLSRMRKKLGPYGIEILSARGVGLSLSQESRGIIRYVLRSPDAQAVA